MREERVCDRKRRENECKKREYVRERRERIINSFSKRFEDVTDMHVVLWIYLWSRYSEASASELHKNL